MIPKYCLMEMVAINRFSCLLIFMFALSRSLLFAQTKTPLLERTVSVNVVNEPLEDVLDKIALQGKFSFSYNPGIIDVKKKVTIQLKNKTVREALVQVLGSGMNFKMKGQHVIL